MTEALQAIAIFFLVTGGLFGLLGSYGMLKLRDPMQRLHAPSKASTVGVGAVLIGGFFAIYVANGSYSWHNLLITLFLFLTAPVASLFLAKAHIFRSVNRADLPDSGTGRPWATLDTSEAQDAGSVSATPSDR